MHWFGRRLPTRWRRWASGRSPTTASSCSACAMRLEPGARPARRGLRCPGAGGKPAGLFRVDRGCVGADAYARLRAGALDPGRPGAARPSLRGNEFGQEWVDVESVLGRRPIRLARCLAAVLEWPEWRRGRRFRTNSEGSRPRSPSTRQWIGTSSCARRRASATRVVRQFARHRRRGRYPRPMRDAAMTLTDSGGAFAPDRWWVDATASGPPRTRGMARCGAAST